MGFAPSCAKAAMVAKLALPVKQGADSEGIFPRSSIGAPGDITHGGERGCVLLKTEEALNVMPAKAGIQQAAEIPGFPLARE